MHFLEHGRKIKCDLVSDVILLVTLLHTLPIELTSVAIGFLGQKCKKYNNMPIRFQCPK